MDPQPETVSPVQSNGKPAAPAVVDQRRKEPGRAAVPNQVAPAGHRANSDARMSIDPMRATDRYRLVVPYSPRF